MPPPPNTGGNDIVTFAPCITDGTTFTYDDVCDLLGFSGEIASTDTGAIAEDLFFSTADQIATGDDTTPYVPATCNIVKNALQCVDQTVTILYVCADALELQIGAVVPGGCAAVTLTPIYQ